MMMRMAILGAALVASFANVARAEVNIQPITSPGGIEAWLVEETSIPFGAIEVWFQGGASLDAPGKRGAVNLMTGLLEEGAGDMDARAFAEAVEELSVRYSWRAYDDTLTVSIEFLSENREAALDLIREALINPRFDQDAIDRVRQQVLAGLKSDATDPDEIMSRTFDALAFGDHPYATDISGTEESVSALTREDLIAAKDATMNQARMFVSAVGDISAEELGPILDRLLGDLPKEAPPLPGPAGFALEGGVTVVDFDVPQSVALFGHTGLTRDDPDFFAAFVLNQILGGRGFDSRLMTEVREKRGLTYGINSFLVPKDHAALVLGQFSSANDRIAEAIEVVKAEWARAGDISQEDLDRAKTYLTGAYPLRFDGNATIANILVGMQMEDLGLGYIAARNANVNAVTLEDIRRVAARLYRPEDLHFVVVGRPEGLQSSE